MRIRPILIIALVIICASCTLAPCRDPGSQPSFLSSKPVQITAMVDQFEHRGAWIDFDHDFIVYDSIVLVVSKPSRYASTQLSVQYQGMPTVNGRRIELGDVLRFTVPVIPEIGCCEPYLDDIGEIEFIGPDD